MKYSSQRSDFGAHSPYRPSHNFKLKKNDNAESSQFGNKTYTRYCDVTPPISDCQVQGHQTLAS